MHKVKVCLMVSLLAATAVTPLQAQESVEQRLQRVEQLVNSRSLLDMSQRIDALQAEVQQLRGQVDEQQHTIEGLRSRQRELYLDIDRRLSRFEREGSAAPAAPADTQKPDDAPPPVDAQRLQQEREAYQEAFDLLRQLQYAQATTAFRRFLKEYPEGRYAHIAQYWLGEAGYAQRDFKQAIIDYQALIANHPKSPKRAEAMLKIGYSHYELKQYSEATAILEQLIEQHPGSTEAGQARSLLKQIRKKSG
ncbi:MAG: tol-pal system protein YbgF [Gammaproteobacteria bacterium]|nr:tol-pal system protein YbgF [Gammaproteobacteria bacterium]MCW8992835.1 tol-pal system protein YbgF [Gammaproteobacteria bacterium]